MPRAMWTGSISFGLVNIPIKLYAAVRDHSVRFNTLSEDGTCRLRQKLYCPETGQEFDFKHTARGYEIAPGQYVIINDDDINRIKPEAGRTIDIVDFVDLPQIDPVYYDRPYYLMPDKQGGRGYQLLLQAMEQQNKVAVGRFVMRSKQYLAAIRPMQGFLGLETMRYQDEVVQAQEEFEAPPEVEVDKREMQIAERLIDALSTDFEPGKYHDEYRQRLLELIEAKAEGQTYQPPQEEEAPQVVNLMEALEKSLAAAREAGGEKPQREKKAKTTKRKKKSA